MESIFCYINQCFAPGLDENVGGLWAVRYHLPPLLRWVLFRYFEVQEWEPRCALYCTNAMIIVLQDGGGAGGSLCYPSCVRLKRTWGLTVGMMYRFSDLPGIHEEQQPILNGSMQTASVLLVFFCNSQKETTQGNLLTVLSQPYGFVEMKRSMENV